ncbi:hypothetical protein ACHAW5_005045 [Stephanodiscus triporus]|uniref:Uncharacterized protein n=1 Tax=Stephanodiscus triporus TaxID=2934178 RepID=A0ABD3MKH2_9STRA
MASDRSAGRPASDYRSFSRGRPAASVHSVHSKHADDKSAVSCRSLRSHRGKKSHPVVQEQVLPIEINIAPKEVRRKANVETNATKPGRRSASAGRRREDVETNEAVDMNRVESAVRMLNVMNLVESTLKKRAVASTSPSPSPFVANDTAPSKPSIDNSKPQYNSLPISCGNGNIGNSYDDSSRHRKLASSSSSSKSSGFGGGVKSRSSFFSNDDVQLDANGCCMYHPFVQLRRPNGRGGWRIMSETCALCFEEEVERSKQESAATMANAAFKEIAAKIANLKVSENLQRLKTAVAPEMHPSNNSPDTSGRGGEEKSITLSILEPSSWADDGSSILSAQSLSEDPKVLPGILQLNDVPRSLASESESAVHSVQCNHKANSNAPPTPKSLASRGSTASSPASNKAPPKPTSSTLLKSSVAPSTATSVSGSSISKSAPKRPPPPPPPPRTIKIAASNKSDANCTNDVHHDMSMAVLNPYPEPELEGEFPLAEIMVQQPSFAPEVMSVPQRSFLQSFAPEVMGMPQRSFSQPDGMVVGMMTQSQILTPEMSMPQRPLSHLEGMTDVQQPDYQHEEHPEVNKSKEWMKYTSKASRRETTEDGNDNVKKSKMFRRESKKKLDTNEQIKSYTVRQMPFTDQFGDFGHYTGQVDDEGRPDGKGIMKYENGVFYEGTWTNGGQDKLAASQYDRIRGGFTSWSGKGKSGVKSGGTLPWNSRKNDAHDASEKTNVRGMEWTDLNGDSGRYTGEVDNDQLPHGSGIMRYDFGLIAEGEWVHGVLKEGPHDRMISAAAMNGGQSVAPRMPINSGMSVGPGAMGLCQRCRLGVA